MKTICWYFLLLIPFAASAQSGTIQDTFQLVVESENGFRAAFSHGYCGYGHSTNGGGVDSLICGEAVLVSDYLGNSTCCDSIAMNLEGKIALIDRGQCAFGYKTSYAYRAGARAIIIMNTETTPMEDSCSATAFYSYPLLVDSLPIPTVLLCKQGSALIKDLLFAGEELEICFRPTTMLAAFGARAYSTPLSQIDTLDKLAILFNNDTPDTLTNLVARATISGPNYSFSLATSQPPVPPGTRRLLQLEPAPPPTELGTYQIQFSVDGFTHPVDTLYRTFELTEHMFALDNGELALSDIILQIGLQFDLRFQTGALYWTGPNPATVEYVQFGISNIESIYVPGNEFQNTFYALLYDADPDLDGVVNLQYDWSDLAMDAKAAGMYVLNGTEEPNELLCVPITRFPGGSGDTLFQTLPNHPYYVSLLHEGEGINEVGPIFSTSRKEQYLKIDGGSPDPFYWGAFYPGGFLYFTFVQRLLLEGAACQTVSEKDRLQIAQLSIFPNPANQYLNIEMQLKKPTGKIRLSLFDSQGRVVKSQNLQHLVNETIQFDVKDLPAGTYILAINTGVEYAVRQVHIVR
ncbi:MAG: T9SS type A sorting domain-containing protein [Saprospiraceae bacterium]